METFGALAIFSIGAIKKLVLLPHELLYIRKVVSNRFITVGMEVFKVGRGGGGGRGRGREKQVAYNF